MLWLCCVITALLVLAAKASNPLSIPSDCKPFNYSICRDILPYNFTRLPNYLKHKTTTAVVEALNNHEYQTLITTNCSSDLVFFLCVLHFPICVQGIRGPVLPCRSLCNKVRRECLPTIKSFNESWPKNIDCDNFPIYEKGVCIKKISLHNTVPPKTPTKRATCRCKTDKQMTWSVSRFDTRLYDFVIYAKVTKILTTGSQKQITLTDIFVFREGKLKINTKSQTIFVDISCPCPYLKNNQYFFIMGWEDSGTKNRLVLTRKGFVYQTKRMKNMRKLKKLKHKNLKQFLLSLLNRSNKSSNKKNG